MSIVDTEFAPVTSEAMAAFLGTLIADYLEELKKLYVNSPLIPKQHFMVQYPSPILE